MPSFAPENFAEGGGSRPQPGDYIVTKARFTNFTYNTREGGTVDTTALRLDFINPDEEEFTQHYSVGNPMRVGFTDDGLKVIGTLNNGSNFYQLMLALQEAGFKADEFGETIDFMEGLNAFWDDKEIIRGGNVNNSTILVPTRIWAKPGEAAPTRSRTAPQRTAPQRAPARNVAVLERGDPNDPDAPMKGLMDEHLKEMDNSFTTTELLNVMEFNAVDPLELGGFTDWTRTPAFGRELALRGYGLSSNGKWTKLD